MIAKRTRPTQVTRAHPKPYHDSDSNLCAPHLQPAMPHHTRNTLRAMSNIPNTEKSPMFDQLWETVRLYLRTEPDNSVSLAGPQKGGQKYLSWVIEYLDSGIGQQYWGSEAEGNWRIDRDRAR